MTSFSDIIKDHLQLKETISNIEQVKQKIKKNEKEINPPSSEFALRANTSGVGSSTFGIGSNMIDNFVNENIVNTKVMVQIFIAGIESGEINPRNGFEVWKHLSQASPITTTLVERIKNQLSMVFSQLQTKNAYNNIEKQKIKQLLLAWSDSFDDNIINRGVYAIRNLRIRERAAAVGQQMRVVGQQIRDGAAQDIRDVVDAGRDVVDAARAGIEGGANISIAILQGAFLALTTSVLILLLSVDNRFSRGIVQISINTGNRLRERFGAALAGLPAPAGAPPAPAGAPPAPAGAPPAPPAALPAPAAAAPPPAAAPVPAAPVPAAPAAAPVPAAPVPAAPEIDEDLGDPPAPISEEEKQKARFKEFIEANFEDLGSWNKKTMIDKLTPFLQPRGLNKRQIKSVAETFLTRLNLVVFQNAEQVIDNIENFIFNLQNALAKPGSPRKKVEYVVSKEEAVELLSSKNIGVKKGKKNQYNKLNPIKQKIMTLMNSKKYLNYGTNSDTVRATRKEYVLYMYLLAVSKDIKHPFLDKITTYKNTDKDEVTIQISNEIQEKIAMWRTDQSASKPSNSTDLDLEFVKSIYQTDSTNLLSRLFPAFVEIDEDIMFNADLGDNLAKTAAQKEAEEAGAAATPAKKPSEDENLLKNFSSVSLKPEEAGAAQGKGFKSLKAVENRINDLISARQLGNKSAKLKKELVSLLSILIDKKKISSKTKNQIMKDLY